MPSGPSRRSIVLIVASVFVSVGVTGYKHVNDWLKVEALLLAKVYPEPLIVTVSAKSFASQP